MRVGASDAASGGLQLSLDWLRASPYASAGTFVSRVFDGGGPTSWGTLVDGRHARRHHARDERPRRGHQPPDRLLGRGRFPGPTAQAGRYLQYRAELATADAEKTPRCCGR